MSGIVAIVQGDCSPLDRELLQDLTAFQAFRGPDGLGLWQDGTAGLGHALLRATVEAEHRPQPCSLDGQVWVTADVRLDGRQDLIGRLPARGPGRLETASDAELILHAYRAWGDECLHHLRGDFAFALWDGPRRRLLSAVDHFRVRPLYYARVGNGLVLSNTLQCVRRHPAVSDCLCEAAVGDFLLFEHYQDPSLTIFADVRLLPPAHFLVWEDGRLRQGRYWSVPAAGTASFRNPRECEGRFNELLDQAVGDRLRGNRVGLFLSGGIDSPLLAVAARRLPKPRQPTGGLKAFTIVYDHLIPHEERYYSGLAARALGLPQVVQRADEFELYEWASQPDWPPPEPLNDPRWAWNVRSFRQVAADCPVILTGDDGDSLLRASFHLHWLELLKARRLGQLARDLAWYVGSQRRLPPVGFRTMLKRRLGRAGPPPFPRWLNPDFSKRADLPARWAEYHRLRPPATARGFAREYLASPLWATVFDSYDPTWTGAPLEARHPLMDVRLVTFLLSLPAVPWCVNKELFRRVLRPILPSELCRRAKTVLRDDPVRVMLWNQGRRWEKSLDFRNEIGSYVNPLALAEPPPNPTTDEAYQWLRPISLGMWLNTQRRKERVE
jgi:asparagine synthase (glutamine-hydrolysing)